MTEKQTAKRWKNGGLTVGTVATRFSFTPLPDGTIKGIVFKAPGPTCDNPNTVSVYLGISRVTADTSLTTDGFPLAPGESISLPLDMTEDIYAIASANDQRLYWFLI